MDFRISYDRTLKIMTIIASLIFAVTIATALYFIYIGDDKFPVYIPILLFVIYVIVFVYRPKSYSITQDSLIIHRTAGNVIIKRSDIAEVEIPEKTIISKAVRTLGVGGLFGYYGSFYQRGIGDMTWYVTNRRNAVLIKTVRNEKIVVSPDEVHRFVQQFK